MATDTLRSSLFARAEKLRNQIEYLMTSKRNYEAIAKAYQEYREVLAELDKSMETEDLADFEG